MVISEDIRTIIWDWNGTLLDDTNICIKTINFLLARRGLPLLNTDRYRNIFTFPVKDYYAEIGFDFKKEPFEVPAREYIDQYNREVMNCGLHRGAVGVLQHFRSIGKQQLVLSAMEQPLLEQTLAQHRIIHFFDKISGLDNHYAHSKIDNGKALIKQMELPPAETCLVGDTIHDYEVAQELGCHCILIANGHQSEERLRKTGCKIITDITKLLN
ncbi:MAG: HAD hydrolase-like protein [Prolixibacteraceae bacterium]|jgi:phosphoglycolate phosphatase|nr:HAD hydrolase-like protein [Prolixibacteraceae bacterium]